MGYTSYDTVRYVESKKLPFANAPDDDRGLPDIHLGLYHDVVVFDHVTKVGPTSENDVASESPHSAFLPYSIGPFRPPLCRDSLRTCRHPV